MIDPEPGDCACAYQFKNQTMNRVEDFWQLHTDCGQIVYIKKAPVIDFLGSDTPKRKTIRLRVQQSVECVETAGVARISVDLCECFFDCLSYRRCLVTTTVQPPLDDFILTGALRDPFRVGFSTFRQIFKCG